MGDDGPTPAGRDGNGSSELSNVLRTGIKKKMIFCRLSTSETGGVWASSVSRVLLVFPPFGGGDLSPLLVRRVREVPWS